MSTGDLPGINAALNGLSLLLLIGGYVAIKKTRKETHRRFMLSALATSAVFLCSYLIYHYAVGSVPYPHYDWTRPVYFAILIPHIVLAAVMVPFILAAVYFALRGRFAIHKRLARWVWPVWVFVSISGIVVYAMLYH